MVSGPLTPDTRHPTPEPCPHSTSSTALVVVSSSRRSRRPMTGVWGRRMRTSTRSLGRGRTRSSSRHTSRRRRARRASRGECDSVRRTRRATTIGGGWSSRVAVAGTQEHAEGCGLLFLSSPFSVEAVELLERIGVGVWKIASGEATGGEVLERVSRTGQPVLLSTGMSPLAETTRRSIGSAPAARSRCCSAPCPTRAHPSGSGSTSSTSSGSGTAARSVSRTIRGRSTPRSRRRRWAPRSSRCTLR